MSETIACLIGICGLLWVALSRYRAGDKKAALFRLSVAIIAIIALIAINTLTVRWLGHPQQNSSAP
jgi:flagellar biogenesis protein FliO